MTNPGFTKRRIDQVVEPSGDLTFGDDRAGHRQKRSRKNNTASQEDVTVSIAGDQM
jgi:hypothetical protein